jgi:hypothetical protein
MSVVQQKMKVLFFGFIAVALSCATAFAQSAGSQPGLQAVKGIRIVRSNVHHDVSAPLRDLLRVNQAAVTSPLLEEEKEAEPVRPIPLRPGLPPPNGAEPVQQTMAFPAPAQFAPTAGTAFDGLGNATLGFTVHSAPPDTNGAVGLTQYVQWVNTSFAIFDKSTGALIAGPTLGSTLWAGFGGGCEMNNNGDPIAVYDKLANRWVLSQFSVTGGPPFLQCVAVSTTPDATGSYNRYSFTYSNFDDYPKMSTWPDAYYVTFNMFNGNTFLGADACAYDRNAMLSGQAATQVCFQQGNNVGPLLPSDLDGTLPPPSGSPNFMVTLDTTTSLALFKFHVDFAVPGNSTFTGPTSITVNSFTPLCNGGTCVPQPGVTQTLDSLGTRLMYRLAYRNFGDHESLVVNHSVAINANTSGGVRWYELQNPNGSVTEAQENIFAPNTDYRWMGSIAMDINGDIALGYSVSSSTTNPSLALTGRLVSDTINIMQAETTVISGTGVQNSASRALSRWGDYSAMQIDPSDDCTFWFTSEYMKTTGIFNWNTRIASYKFPSCGLRFVPVTPCRVADTRNANGPFGGPFLSGNSARGFTIPASACGIPSTAQAYSLNFTVVPKVKLAFLTAFPCGQPQPLASTLNSDGRIKAVAGIVPAGTDGSICTFVTDDTDLVLDIDGYFVPTSNASALAFFPMTPCRLVDTRGATGPLGGPSMAGNAARTFPILSSTCNVPAAAQAYSLNFTSVPKTAKLDFLTTWPAGQTQPLVSTLNASTGKVTANGAIVPAGTNGDVSVFVTDNSDLVMDINGYFAPPAAGGLSFHTLSPCRVVDTRNPPGSQPFNGMRNVNVNASGCGVPASAQAYVLNATVVPPGALGFLTLWPQGASQPLVSTLNAGDGVITSNIAIVPTTNGSVSAFVSDPSHLVLDISGYFAP